MNAKLPWRAPKPPNGGPIGPGRSLMLLVMVGLLGACGSPDRPATPTPPVAVAPTQDSRPRQAAPSPGAGLPHLAPSPVPSPGLADALVRRAVTDAAERAGTAPEAVAVILAEPRVWADRSLGCPQPGMGYAQSITPGYLIIVEANGQHFRYHADHVQIEYCDRPS